MKDKETIRNRQVEYLRMHTLTPEEKHKLIQGKVERAQQYLEAWRKREELIGKHR